MMFTLEWKRPARKSWCIFILPVSNWIFKKHPQVTIDYNLPQSCKIAPGDLVYQNIPTRQVYASLLVVCHGGLLMSAKNTIYVPARYVMCFQHYIPLPPQKNNIAPEEHGCLGNCPFLLEISAHFWWVLRRAKNPWIWWRNRPPRPEKNV